MIFTLDDPGADDPRRSGAKAAWLARARRAGLPVPPGLVLDAAVSRPYLTKAAEALAVHGSGRARLLVSGSELEPVLKRRLVEEASKLGSRLAVRSSSVLETGGEWAGAFSSYLDVDTSELEKTVLGCWASVFTVDSLHRFEATGLEPHTHPMAVLIQPYLDPSAGGVAWIEGDTVRVEAVPGSPAGLLGGWVKGTWAEVDSEGQVSYRGTELAPEAVAAAARVLRHASSALGVDHCEWIYTDRLWLLQLHRRGVAETRPRAVPTEVQPQVLRIARIVRRAPGPLGERLVLPWAVAAGESTARPWEGDPALAFDRAVELSRELAASVWGLPPGEAVERAVAALRALRGEDPEGAAELFEGLTPPDPNLVAVAWGAVDATRRHLADSGVVAHPHLAWFLEPSQIEAALSGERMLRRDRAGFDRWEPLNAAVAVAAGTATKGRPASGGLGAGRMVWIEQPDDLRRFRPRDVVVVPRPLPQVAPLLWDAAGLVTLEGSPAAHLFESARSLAVPAVCGIEPAWDPASTTGRLLLAVDGDAGIVYSMDW